MPLQVRQRHPRSQCCRIPQCVHQCATHECVGAQMLWNSLRHRLLLLLCLRKMRTPMPVTRETPSVQQPVTPHTDTKPETPFPTSSTDDDPMPLLQEDDTPPWVYQEPETSWTSTEQDTPAIIPQQVPSPPIQISPSREESNMSTGDPIIPPPPWFDETPPPPSTTHEDILPPAPSFDETPPLKTAQAPETLTIPSVAKRWRSGTLHLENPVSKRWRSDTLHPATPVPTTTPPQLR